MLSSHHHHHQQHHDYHHHRPRYYFSMSSTESNNAAPEWSIGKVLQNTRNAEGLRLIDIEVPESLSSTYIHPGQYVKLKAGDTKPAFLAIASPPSKGNIFSFLIKETASNGYITTAKEGELFDLSVALGKGFQIKEYFDNYKNDFPVNNILLMACGSGLAPIAAAIDSGNLGLRETGYTTIFERKAILYIGARTPDHLPFASKYPAWEKQGIRIVPVISQPTAKWNGRTGYIQDALREDLVPVPKNTAALLCGVRDMQDNVKELLLESGVFEGRILLNF